MKYCIAFIFFLTFFFIPTKAQSDFKAGYIINNNHDTIHGLIDNNSNLYNECRFKSTNEGTVIIYKPFDIIAFRLNNGKYFISRNIQLQNSYSYIQKQEYDPTVQRNVIISSQKEKEGTYNKDVFIEFLVQGQICLYYYYNMQDHYFMEGKDKPFQELTQNENIVYNQAGGSYINKPETYKNIILMIMKDAPVLATEVNTSHLRHRDLIQITKDYHNYVCKDDKCIVFERNVQKQYKLILSTGTNISTYRININSEMINGLECTYKSEPTPFFDVSIRVDNSLPQVEKISFQGGIYYQYLKYTYENPFHLSNYNNQFTCKASSINPSIKAIYFFSTSRYKPFISGGLAGNILFGIKNTYSPVLKKDYDYILGLDYDKAIWYLSIGAGFSMPIGQHHELIVDITHYQSYLFHTNFSIGFTF